MSHLQCSTSHLCSALSHPEYEWIGHANQRDSCHAHLPSGCIYLPDGSIHVTAISKVALLHVWERYLGELRALDRLSSAQSFSYGGGGGGVYTVTARYRPCHPTSLGPTYTHLAPWSGLSTAVCLIALRAAVSALSMTAWQHCGESRSGSRNQA